MGSGKFGSLIEVVSPETLREAAGTEVSKMKKIYM